MRRTITANSFSEALNRIRSTAASRAGFCGSPGEFENHYHAFKAARLVTDEPAVPAEIGTFFQPQVGEEGVSVEDMYCANNIIQNRASRIASVNWGSTAGLDTVQYKIPHYIMKGISRHPDRVTSTVCIEMITKLLLLGCAKMITSERDDVGVYLRKGVKRTLGEAERNQSWQEPGCGGNYSYYHETESDVDDDVYPYDEWENEADSDMELADIPSQLNGSHGEWTESDDVKGKGRQGQGQVRMKDMLRAMVKQQLADVIGPSMAKTVYTAGSKAARGLKKKNRAKQNGKPGKASSVRRVSEGSNPRSYYSGDRLILGPGSRKWAKAAINPFDLSLKQIGVPRQGSQPSHKATGFVRGTGYIGDGGVGYVYVMPTLANDRAIAGVTTDDYEFNMLAQFDSTVPVMSQHGSSASPKSVYMNNLPYTAAQLQGTGISMVEGRIVSVSVRAMYTGTNLNKSGNYYAMVQPDFVSIIGGSHAGAVSGNGYTVDTMAGFDCTEISSVQQVKESRLIWVPNHINLYDYPLPNASAGRKVYPYAENQMQFDGATACGTGAIMITGMPGETFYFEIVLHAEYTGPGVVQGLLTESISDAVGFDAVACALMKGQRMAASQPNATLGQTIRAELKAERIVY